MVPSQGQRLRTMAVGLRAIVDPQFSWEPQCPIAPPETEEVGGLILVSVLGGKYVSMFTLEGFAGLPTSLIGIVIDWFAVKG